MADFAPERIEIQIHSDLTKRLRDTPATELARILRKLADDFERDGGPVTRPNGRHAHAGLRDSAGKPCGCIVITPAGNRAIYG